MIVVYPALNDFDYKEMVNLINAGLLKARAGETLRAAYEVYKQEHAQCDLKKWLKY